MKWLMLVFAMLLAAPAGAAEQRVNLSVPGMYCASCPYIVEAAIGEVEGVISVAADAGPKTALVVFDDEMTTPEEIMAASANAGYAASVIEGGS